MTAATTVRVRLRRERTLERWQRRIDVQALDDAIAERQHRDQAAFWLVNDEASRGRGSLAVDAVRMLAIGGVALAVMFAWLALWQCSRSAIPGDGGGGRVTASPAARRRSYAGAAGARRWPSLGGRGEQVARR